MKEKNRPPSLNEIASEVATDIAFLVNYRMEKPLTLEERIKVDEKLEELSAQILAFNEIKKVTNSLLKK
jgi:hypothetical protein